jgi:hypothetical protein
MTNVKVVNIMSAQTNRNRYMAKYMRAYRARKAAEQAELRAQVEQREPETQAMFAKILEAVNALSERVARIEAALTQVNIKELTEPNVKPNSRKLTKANVNKGEPPSIGPVKRKRINVKANKLTKANVSKGKQPSPSASAEELAREAKTLHAKGISYEQIAKRWTEKGMPTLKGGRWHKGTIANMVKRHAEGL